MKDTREFIRGMDISSFLEMEDKGYQYYDYERNPVDLLQFAKQEGFNYVRLRIWNEPWLIEESGGYCDLEKTLQMAKIIKKYGYGFFLDFHYSDWWADPGHQKKPKAWEHLNDTELKEAVYLYTKEVLYTLKNAGTVPDMVQIGNEIRTGMLFPEGAVKNWTGLAGLINSGIRAVRDTLSREETKVVIHLDQGGRYVYYKEWFDAAIENGVEDFDIIALSYYPFWHGTFYEFKNTMENLVKEYGKDLLVAETAHAFQRSNGTFFGEAQEHAAGFFATPKNQRKVLELIESIIANVSEKKGMGFFYWEPFMRMPKDMEGWGSCMALVDENGVATEGLRAISYHEFEKNKDKIAKVYVPLEIEIATREHLHKMGELLPKVKALKMDGTLMKKEIMWQSALEEEDGIYEVSGVVEGYEEIVKVKAVLKEIRDRQQNFLNNASFEKGMQDWEVNVTKGNDCLEINIGKEKVQEVGVLEQNVFFFRAEEICEWILKTKSQPLKKGSYQLSCRYKGDNTTGVEIHLFAKTKEKTYLTQIFPQDEEWMLYQITNIQVQEKELLEVGIKVSAPPVYGKVIQFCLTPNF